MAATRILKKAVDLWRSADIRPLLESIVTDLGELKTKVNACVTLANETKTDHNTVATLVNELKADYNATLAKLDADAGVTDVDYAAENPVAAADAGSVAAADATAVAYAAYTVS